MMTRCDYIFTVGDRDLVRVLVAYPEDVKLADLLYSTLATAHPLLPISIRKVAHSPWQDEPVIEA